ncbi:N-acetylmuramoyl-L-alanine amidase [Mesonia ostreae]|uniref:N-acetylmuramoyl-L-alanine amidase n=1 Tax=Mesonia ostreae TaxID=861110 RepID=A0ABU2KFQ5_9FLAO|nr:N-acetylmuramoyl-L-alanine amidase [Mesonia ostreae]MDT0293547.1 N-acetylmuramoyl-L-alanine amidase [Mesonia ostreae]
MKLFFKHCVVKENNMLRLVALLGFVFWLMPTECFSQKFENKPVVIVIDPGHGGTDSGAVGNNGIQEKNVVLKVAKEIERLNESLFKNRFGIYLTRYTDTLISLGDRTKLARKLKADLFISLHCNHSENPNAKGFEVYVFNRKNKQTKESILLAYELQKGMQLNLGFRTRGVKFADFQVLREASNRYPALLIEMGFLSNRDESLYLNEHENLRKVSRIIYITLTKYLIL